MRRGEQVVAVSTEPAEFAGKHLLLVGTGGVKRRRVLEALRGLGLRRITCLHDQQNWAAPYVDDWVIADSVTWSHATLEIVRRTIGRPDAVFTYDDYSVIVAAHLAAAFGLPGTPPAAVERAKDKSAFREICTSNGLPAPRFIRIDAQKSDVEALLATARLSFPVVLKPTHGAGSVLVRRADDIGELKQTIQSYAQSVANEPAAALWPDRSALVEEYLTGDEVDIDMLLQGGELKYAAVTDNFAPVEPYFLELGGQAPSALPQQAQDELVRVAFAVLRAIGVSDACVHFEARWTARGAVPIEANLRLGGAEVYEFNRSANGVDLLREAAAIALGVPIRQQPATPLPACFVRSAAFNPPCAGRLSSIAVDEAVSVDDALGELVIFRGAGDEIRTPPDGFDYLGWIVARGSTRGEADTNLARLLRGVRFTIGSTTFHGAYLGGGAL